MNNKILTIIVPALKSDEKFELLLASVRASSFPNSQLEFLVVTPYPEQFCNLNLPNINIISQPKSGIYSAMNRGIAEANGKFIYFVGQDDFVLPNFGFLRSVLVHDFDIIICDVVYGSNKKLYRNICNKHWLIYRNWCHQGVLYNLESFKSICGVYDLRYNVQADHLANIKFATKKNIRMKKIDYPIAYYSTSGFSSQVIDCNWKRDLHRIYTDNYGALIGFIYKIKKVLWR